MNDVIQIAILVLGGAAIWLVSRPEPWSRWGYLVGLVSQPFWLWASWHSGQWGMFLLSLFYSYAWCQGIWFYWLKPENAR